MAPYGAIWRRLAPFGAIWREMAPNGDKWHQMAKFGEVWRRMAPFGYLNIYCQMAPDGAIWRLKFCTWFFSAYASSPRGDTAKCRQDLANGECWRSPNGATRRRVAPDLAMKMASFGDSAHSPDFGAKGRHLFATWRHLANLLAPNGARWRHSARTT